VRQIASCVGIIPLRGKFPKALLVQVFNEARENGGKVVWGPLKKESVKKFYVAKAGK
jgi:hypothetical protein